MNIEIKHAPPITRRARASIRHLLAEFSFISKRSSSQLIQAQHGTGQKRTISRIATSGESDLSALFRVLNTGWYMAISFSFYLINAK
jgi:hypothetical protein